MGVTDTGINGASQFPATSLSVIRNARDPASPDHDRDLRRLVELYWRPVYCVIRHGWNRPQEEAKDLTQEFFATIVFQGELAAAHEPVRGSFRALLRASIGNFMRAATRDAGRQKRGGNAIVVALADVNEAALEMPDAQGLSPDEIFERAFRRDLFNRAMAALERQLGGEGRGDTFALFRAHDLEEPAASLPQCAARFGLTEPQARYALRVGRTRFRQALVDILRTELDSIDDSEAEMRALLGC